MKTNLFRLAIIFLGASWLSGCEILLITAAVGGAGYGGYYVGSDEREAGEIASDAGITSRIKTSLLTTPGVDSLMVDVDTYHGAVTLRGSQPTQEAREQVIRIAQETSGVTKVISKLTVIPKEDVMQ